MQEAGRIAPMLELLRNKLPKLQHGVSNGFCYVQLYMEKLLPLFTLNEQLWKLYCGFTADLCSGDNEERLRILRCSLKNCYTSSDLWIGYLLELERQGNDRETIEAVVGQAREQM